jgi:hypothetical protein
MSKTRISHNLVNVEKRAKRFPEDFHLPSFHARYHLRAGDKVKLVFRDIGECLWVEVGVRSFDEVMKPFMARLYIDYRYVGRIVSEPIHSEVKRGDRVTFGPEHVADILPSAN